jgi:hypothetical protein
LTNVYIPASVTNIWADAFNGCDGLQNVFYQGNAPNASTNTFLEVSFVFGGTTFYMFPQATNYYLPGTTGWTSTLGGLPTAWWFQPQPLILGNLENATGPGVRNQAFGFTVSWATNTSVVILTSTNLSNPAWIPIQTNALTGGTNYFSDAKWTNAPARYYRVKSM